MKYLITILFLFNCNFTFANHHANDEEKKEIPLVTELPTNYKKFVEIVGLLTTDEIISILPGFLPLWKSRASLSV